MHKQLVFVRHGESSANACPDSRLLKSYDDDHVALSETGCQQARECRRLMQKELHLHFDLPKQASTSSIIVYTSPKLRAVQTSTILGLADRHIIDRRLAEHNIPNFADAASRDFYRKEAKRFGKYTYRYPHPGGESGEDVAVRLSAFLQDVATSTAAAQADVILIICHEVVIRAAFYLLGDNTGPKVFDEIHIDNCEWVVFPDVNLDLLA